jgi:hypothetical protein
VVQAGHSWEGMHVVRGRSERVAAEWTEAVKFAGRERATHVEERDLGVRLRTYTILILDERAERVDPLPERPDGWLEGGAMWRDAPPRGRGQSEAARREFEAGLDREPHEHSTPIPSASSEVVEPDERRAA